jgi:hypothetical protein
MPMPTPHSPMALRAQAIKSHKPQITDYSKLKRSASVSPGRLGTATQAPDEFPDSRGNRARKTSCSIGRVHGRTVPNSRTPHHFQLDAHRAESSHTSRTRNGILLAETHCIRAKDCMVDCASERWFSTAVASVNDDRNTFAHWQGIRAREEY